MADKQVKHDKYCWRCCTKNTTLKCSLCVRSFHKRCVPIDDRAASKEAKWLCPVCAVLTTSHNVDNENDRKIVTMLIDKVWKNEEFDRLKYSLENFIHADPKVIHSIVNPMSLTQIKGKAIFYIDFNEFYVDVCWIVHNSVILYNENHANTKAARSLLDCIVEEVQSARACIECYTNATNHPNDWFSMVCNEIHLILWIKEAGAHCYWPAKLYSVSGEEAKVCLFGDHSYVNVSSKNCFLYSESNPSRIPRSSDAYNDALKEANAYIGSLVKKFGSFRFAESKTAFNPALLEYYTAQLIPGSVEQRKNKNAANFIDCSDVIDLCSDDSPRIIREADTTCPDDGEHAIEPNPMIDESEAMVYGSYELNTGNDNETDFQSRQFAEVDDNVIVID